MVEITDETYRLLKLVGSTGLLDDMKMHNGIPYSINSASPEYIDVIGAAFLCEMELALADEQVWFVEAVYHQDHVLPQKWEVHFNKWGVGGQGARSEHATYIDAVFACLLSQKGIEYDK